MCLPSCILENPVFQTGQCSRCSSRNSFFLDMPRCTTWCRIISWQGSLEDQTSLVEAIKKVDVVIYVVKGPQLTDQLIIIKAIKEVGTIKVYSILFMSFETCVYKLYVDENSKCFFTTVGHDIYRCFCQLSLGMTSIKPMEWSLQRPCLFPKRKFAGPLRQKASLTHMSLATVLLGGFCQVWGSRALLPLQGIKLSYLEMEMPKVFTMFSLLKSLCFMISICSCTLWAVVNPSYIGYAVVFVKEEDIGTFTIKAVDDPRTLNKILYLRLPANTYSINELVALWEKKIGNTLEKTYIPEEEVLKKIAG